MRTRAFLLPCLAAIAACGLFDSEADLSHAAAMLVCGPADDPFAQVVLARDPIESAQPPFPYVLVVFLEPVSSLAGRTWDITTATGPGAWYVLGRANTQPALSGRVRVTSVDSTFKIDGTVDLQFSTRAVEQGFSAPWLNTGRTCP